MDRAIEGSPQKRLNDEARIDDALSCFIDPLSTNRGTSPTKNMSKSIAFWLQKQLMKLALQ
jgi:hypothetical protein